ncbi:extracellular solute-binding protein [Actinomadura namibiensis]|uniref:Cellobiose transport system substrate-binding protein n=1 Tax=Actinomadura namibiensis TaxID=182080 RepID=A0A7W3LPT9_ACTNM|nr:extracellular solute-binding protein [Actinomadura namibiensis]MBA8952070.1 cellobiose transport system substrate-binding protein [Actinomadura namibiensis]
MRTFRRKSTSPATPSAPSRSLAFGPARGTRRAVAVVLAGLLTGGALTACGGGDDKGGDAGGGGPVELTVDIFGEFGYDELYKQFEASHPNVKIKQRKVSTLDDYKPRLQQWIATNSGAGDVVALEEGILPLYMQQPGKFVNLYDHGGRELQNGYLPWKWQMGVTPDGKQLVGLGTDIGPLAMCYRKDLFEKAGLPSKRDEVGKLWPTWDAFLDTGLKFRDKVPDTKWLDGPAALLRTTVLQNAGSGPGYSYFDKSNNLVFESNPAVRSAFDTVLKFEQNKLTSGMQIFTPPWQTALKRDTFATLPCPSWMLGGIKEFAGDSGKGKWDVAPIPGGAGYWGGSWLAVPKQSKHPKEAAELAKFLTNAQGQVAAFKSKNTFPSSPQAQQDAAVSGSTDPYFGDAPTGKIFSQMAAQVKPVHLGPKNEDVRQVVENVLIAVGQGKVKPEEAWAKAVEEVKKTAR